MRREGYELQVGQPQVIIKEIDGVKNEPIEVLTVDVPQEYSGKVIEFVSQRKGEMLLMEPKGDLVRLEFDIPARGLIGLRNAVLTATAGEAIMAHRFKGFEPWKGTIPGRIAGVLISKEKGPAIAYSIDRLQDRGKHFSNPVLNSEYSYFLNNLDSVAFLSTIELEKATIVSNNLTVGSKIRLLSAGSDSYHLLNEKS